MYQTFLNYDILLSFRKFKYKNKDLGENRSWLLRELQKWNALWLKLNATFFKKSPF